VNVGSYLFLYPTEVVSEKVNKVLNTHSTINQQEQQEHQEQELSDSTI
jgi:hypothetical protein